MSTAPPHRLFLLDGMALVYRAHFAFIARPIINSQGLNTSAIFGFANTLVELIKSEKPTHLAVVFDTPAPTARHVEFPAYKAQREEMPEDLSLALPYVKRLVEAMNIPMLAVDGYEADDVIGTLARQAEKDGTFVTYMVTPDKDFAQLVDEKTFIYKPGRQGADHEVLDLEKIKETWGVEHPEQVIDILGLWGDTADNIPGVPGFGEKTAKALIHQYGSVENIIAHAEELKGKQRERILEFADQARLCRKLATIWTDSPVPVGLGELKLQPMNEAVVKSLLMELEFNQLGKRLFGDAFHAGRGLKAPLPAETEKSADNELGDPDEVRRWPTPALPAIPSFAELKKLAEVEHDYRLLTPADLVAWPHKMTALAVDADSTDPRTAKLRGVALSWQAGVAGYLPCHELIPRELYAWLSREDILKVGHDLKYDLNVLLWHELPLAGAWHDVMLAQALIDPDQRTNLAWLSEAFLGRTPISAAAAKDNADTSGLLMLETDAETSTRMDRTREKADLSLQVMEKLRTRLTEARQEDIFYNIETPLLPVLAQMERTGIKVDLAVLRETGRQLEGQISAQETEVYRLAGRPFNLNSPKQLGQVLFDELRLAAKPKKTKTGQYVTSEDVLQELAGAHPIVEKLLEYREASKLKSTYVDALPAAISPRSGRVHTNYLQVSTATGRLASNQPNLQNIPIRSAQGREIRRAFVACQPDWLLLSADYSQVELRIMAELSGDPSMLEAFRRGVDIHAATAAKVYGVELALVSSEMRRTAKMVNFGIIYGISAFGLGQRLGMPRTEAQRLIDEYLLQYPRIRQFMESTIEQARRDGFVQTLSGRRRYLRDIGSANATVRKAAERTAINSPIQGTAADLIKLAMVRIAAKLRTSESQARLLLQVHDELVFECPVSEVDELTDCVRGEMQHALPLKVPVQVDFSRGSNWMAAHV